MRVRNKSVILELLAAGVAFEKIAVAAGLDPDQQTHQILTEAARRHVPVDHPQRKRMPLSRSGTVHEPVIGFLAQQKTWRLDTLLAELAAQNKQPFFLLMNQVHLPTNIGAITRTAYAAGVNGLVFQGAKDDFFNEETVHTSLGAIARIPHVKLNAREAVEVLRAAGVRVFALQMGGVPYAQQDLAGPMALVLGAEREGVSAQVAGRCDATLTIPMQSGIDSLNVAVSASIVLYEKVRQEGANFLT